MHVEIDSLSVSTLLISCAKLGPLVVCNTGNDVKIGASNDCVVLTKVVDEIHWVFIVVGLILLVIILLLVILT